MAIFTGRVRVPEKAVQQQIVAALRAIGAAVYVLGHPSPSDGRTHRGTGQTPGLPDLLAFVPRVRNASVVPVFIEVKAAGGRMRPAQEVFEMNCHRSGVTHVVGDLDAVYAWLIHEGILHEQQIPHYRLPAQEAGHGKEHVDG